jgi:hypothetical protein
MRRVICFDSVMPRGVVARPGDTIAVMAKFKPVRKKAKGPAPPPGGLPCVILAVLILLLGMFFLYYVMSHANG